MIKHRLFYQIYRTKLKAVRCSVPNFRPEHVNDKTSKSKGEVKVTVTKQIDLCNSLYDQTPVKMSTYHSVPNSCSERQNNGELNVKYDFFFSINF